MTTTLPLRRRIRELAEQEHEAVLKRLRATPFYQHLGQEARDQLILEATGKSARWFHLKDQLRRVREANRIAEAAPDVIARDQARNAAAADFWKDRKDPFQLWVDAAIALADQTEQLVRSGYPIGMATIGGPRFKALRTALAGVKKASAAKIKDGRESLDQVRRAALTYIEHHPDHSRKAVAKAIAKSVKRSADTVEKKLAALRLPPPKARVKK